MSTMNKTIRTHDMVSNNFFLGRNTNATSSVLMNVDTSGMTKLQKKKLKKKLKKQVKNDEEQKGEDELQIPPSHFEEFKSEQIKKESDSSKPREKD